MESDPAMHEVNIINHILTTFLSQHSLPIHRILSKKRQGRIRDALPLLDHLIAIVLFYQMIYKLSRSAIFGKSSRELDVFWLEEVI